jgi:fatty-acyl-CoA synthase
MNLYSIVERMAREYPSREFVVDGSARFTYGEFDQRVNRVAVALAELGVGSQDCVAVVMRNSSLMLEVMYAAAKLGAIWLPVNWRLAPTEWSFILDNAEAGTVIVDREFAADLQPAAADRPGRRVLVHDDGGGEEWGAFLDSVPARDLPTAVVPLDQPARLMYTSGTTAHPKGVVLTHGNVLFKNAAYEREFEIAIDDAVLLVGPLFHVGGLDAPGIAVANQGGKLVVMASFETIAVLDAIERERITTMYAAPTMVTMMLEELDRDRNRDMGSMRLLVCGGFQSTEEQVHRTLDAFPKAAVVNGYGMTETVGSDIFLDNRREPGKIGSVGRLVHPMLYQQLRVVDDDGDDVAPGTPGEILVSGAKTSPGYWRDAEANRRSFEGGWFRTSDIGEVDEDGYLYIVDRKKDMIKSGGENIGSLEIERVVHTFAEVDDVAAVGMPDPRWDEVPVVFVTLVPGRELSAAELQDRCRAQLAKFKVPKRAFFVPELPRTASGKVKKDELRKLAAAAPADQRRGHPTAI